MIRAVLLDLDDSLLTYPQGDLAFIKAYVVAVEAFFNEQYQLPNIGQVLLQGVKVSTQNLDPTQANVSIYESLLAQQYGEERLPEILAGFDIFYETIYPTLQHWVHTVSPAADLIHILMERGLMVVIATNPIYPLTGVTQRMAWGGLDPELDYARITHTRNSHFTKPHPHYYLEILAHLGCDPDEALMVGDSWNNDMVGATQAGLHTFYLSKSDEPPPLPINGQGTLADLLNQVNDHWLEQLTPLTPTPEQLKLRLVSNLAAFFNTLADMPFHFWNQHPQPNEWSPIEIVNHLYQYEKEVQRPQLALIAREENPFIRAPKRPPQPYQISLADQDGMTLAHQFAQERQLTLEWLATLPTEAWTRPARHSLYGPTTLLEMAVFASRHDHLHIRQLCQTIGECE